jgi:S-disulfanyl-L-cysteine oxidoreductase SoxD
LNEADIVASDISIQPDGSGLPPGSGTAVQGTSIFAEKCGSCHGPEGKGGITSVTAAPLPPLIGGDPITDISAVMKRIANFWPHSMTLFDYIRRAMTWQQPMTLSSGEVYALTAYILALNKLIGENDTMNAQTQPKVKMPNRDGFIVRFPDAIYARATDHQRIHQLVAMVDFPMPRDSRSSIPKRQQPAAEEWVVGVRLLDHWPCADALRTEAIGTWRGVRAAREVKPLCCRRLGSSARDRVGAWRGGCRPNISVAAPFVWRCLTGSTLAPFPHSPGRRRQSPASASHRT